MSRHLQREDILARLDDSREELDVQLAGLGAAVNLSRRLKNAVRQYPLRWLAGSIGTGVVLSSLLQVGRGKPRKEEADSALSPSRPMMLGVVAFLVNQVMAFSLPALRHFAESELSHWLKSRPSRAPVEEVVED